MSATRHTIDLFSDIVCPWCFIGTRRLELALAGEDDVTVRHRPFLLDPGTPAEGVNIAERLRRKYGGDPKKMFARVEEAARSSGLELDLSRQTRTYPTAAAHTLVRHAEERGTQGALVNALFAAHFTDARNIADPAVLAEIGERHGFTAGEAAELVSDEQELALTRQLAARASAAGITGVPFFVFDDRYAMSGAQPPEILRQAIDRMRQPQVETEPEENLHE